MEKGQLNDWELDIDNRKVKKHYDINLENLYEHAHSELSLQQSKRDQIITIYLALCSFLLPFALGDQIKTLMLKGIIFTVLGAIGILFSIIVIRYKEYKDAYWACCQTITVLQGFEMEAIDKATVQRVFYYCIKKKGNKYLTDKRGNIVLNKWLFIKKNLISAETIHLEIIALMSAFITGLEVVLMCKFSPLINILVGIAIGALILFTLVTVYFLSCIKLYAVLEVDEIKTIMRKKAKISTEAFQKPGFCIFIMILKVEFKYIV